MISRPILCSSITQSLHLATSSFCLKAFDTVGVHLSVCPFVHISDNHRPCLWFRMHPHYARGLSIWCICIRNMLLYIYYAYILLGHVHTQRYDSRLNYLSEENVSGQCCKMYQIKTAQRQEKALKLIHTVHLQEGNLDMTNRLNKPTLHCPAFTPALL